VKLIIVGNTYDDDDDDDAGVGRLRQRRKTKRRNSQLDQHNYGRPKNKVDC
jgi:hypothetical protein